MAVLNGFGAGVQFVPGPAAAVADNPGPSPTTSTGVVVDGTPIRVVVLALSAAVGLVALRAAGFRFNVGVSA